MPTQYHMVTALAKKNRETKYFGTYCVKGSLITWLNKIHEQQSKLKDYKIFIIVYSTKITKKEYEAFYYSATIEI